MQPLTRPGTLLLLMSLLFFTQCRKDISCENCPDDPLSPPPGTNRPPIACAGTDVVVVLPTPLVTLKGSCSSDPDGNLSSYKWTKISGPASFSILNASYATTDIEGLVEGVALFELLVTDAAGLSSKDTVQVTVKAGSPIESCDFSARPRVNARLTPAGAISITGSGVMAVAAGNKIVFAWSYPRYTFPIDLYSKVDILDVATQTWTTHQLPEPRAYGASAVLGNKIFLASQDQSGRTAPPIDVYDASTGAWSILYPPHKSTPYHVQAAAATGTKVLFVSGMYKEEAPYTNYTLVDLYDVVTGKWRTDTLHGRTKSWAQSTLPDDGMVTTVIGSRVYIAGNASDWNSWIYGTVTKDINIYDAATDTWTTDALRDGRGFMAAIAVGTKNYWAGGIKSWWNSGATEGDQTCTGIVEIKDAATGATTFGCLSMRRAFFSAVQKDNKIIFFTGIGCSSGYDSGDITFDIYDIATTTWSIGVLPMSIKNAAIVSVNNTVYVAAGTVNGSWSNKVWKLEL